jgi:hypothetical protein
MLVETAGRSASFDSATHQSYQKIYLFQKMTIKKEYEDKKTRGDAVLKRDNLPCPNMKSNMHGGCRPVSCL